MQKISWDVVLEGALIASHYQNRAALLGLPARLAQLYLCLAQHVAQHQELLNAAPVSTEASLLGPAACEVPNLLQEVVDNPMPVTFMVSSARLAAEYGRQDVLTVLEGCMGSRRRDDGAPGRAPCPMWYCSPVVQSGRVPKDKHAERTLCTASPSHHSFGVSLPPQEV